MHARNDAQGKICGRGICVEVKRRNTNLNKLQGWMIHPASLCLVCSFSTALVLLNNFGFVKLSIGWSHENKSNGMDGRIKLPFAIPVTILKALEDVIVKFAGHVFTECTWHSYGVVDGIFMEHVRTVSSENVRILILCFDFLSQHLES